jgi:hypothetical protein
MPRQLLPERLRQTTHRTDRHTEAMQPGRQCSEQPWVVLGNGPLVQGIRRTRPARTRRPRQRSPAAQDLPAGQLVSVGVTGHLVHRLGRQRAKRHSPRRALRRDLADYAAQWVVTRRRVVAVRGDDDGAAAGDSAGQVTEPVERGVVGPVQVLQDDHGELAAALSSSRKTANSSRRSTSAAQLDQSATYLDRDLVQRSEWAGRKAPVARTPPPAQFGVVLPKHLDQRRLANPGFAGHQHEPPGAGRCVVRIFVQRPQEVSSLEELHVRSQVLFGLAARRSAARRTGRAGDVVTG